MSVTPKGETFSDIVTDALISDDEVKFTPQQKDVINDKLFMARFNHNKQIKQAQRAGKGRLELQRKKVEESNDKKPVKHFTAIDSKKSAPVKAKVMRTKKLLKQKAKKQLEEKTVFEVPGIDTEHKTVRLHLTDVEADLNKPK